MQAKYSIQDADFYNFDETGFMMGVICGNMVVTSSDRKGRAKQLQSGNREWATAIECRRVRTLRKANTALSKRRKAKRTRVQDGGSLTIEDAQKLIAEKEDKGLKRQKRSNEEGAVEAGPSTSRRCGRCGKTGHNVRTCQEVEEISGEENSIECS
ncbi:hypothetical protein GMDG_08397 [Pseudogymnoascus destructans 20631-21]|uniref:CCHC-type domain-containing protein n=1 Tax=Pseudogymnoascus destructans (strain ATCC MYA-4855 / 20631-21) TaxID=658429 RepID=L8G2M7_PSED2|nr:hypothetical protein GMDG_08397 [Pseudogymnoascus destructans 20631-21]